MKIVMFVLGLVVISYVLMKGLEGTKKTSTVDANGNVVAQPGQQNPGKSLDNVRGAASRIEADQNARTNRADGTAGQ